MAAGQIELAGLTCLNETKCCSWVKNPTLRLPFFGRQNIKDLAEAKSLMFLVARGGIEPAKQGFSILCSTD
jgi:hypothetical protein